MTELTITDHGETRQVRLNPKGSIIGRGTPCDIIIESRDISRQHVRIFQDPFGRWVAEDLQSSNGVFINGRREQSSVVLPGEIINIGSFSLSILQGPGQQHRPDDSISTTPNIVMHTFETEVIWDDQKQNIKLSPLHLEQLAELTEELSGLTSTSILYERVCMYLTHLSKTAAAVFRVPSVNEPMPHSPELLAGCFRGPEVNVNDEAETPRHYPSHIAFRVSSKVLQSVRTNGRPIMVRSIYSSDKEITSTLVNAHSPRVVMCVPLGDITKPLDLLYLDLPVDKTTQDTFAFLQAAAQEVISARKAV